MGQNFNSVAALSPNFSRCHSNQNTLGPNTTWRPQRIAVVNIMDNSKPTEAHFRTLLERAAPNAEIIWCRMACAKDDLHKTEPHYFRDPTKYLLSPHIKDWHEVIGVEHLDQVFVTGIDRGNLPYDELAETYPLFWDEYNSLVSVIDETTKTGKTGHGVLICWAGIAAAKILQGVDKQVYDRKLYGVYDHDVIAPRHALLKGLEGENFRIPHSRVSHMDETELTQAIERSNGRVVLRGPDGPAVWTMNDDRLAIIIGHPEYGESTLDGEFKRDTDKLRQKTGNPEAVFPAPQNYQYGSQKTREDFNYLKQTFCPTLYRNLVELAADRKNEANLRLALEHNQSSELKNSLRQYAL